MSDGSAADPARSFAERLRALVDASRNPRTQQPYTPREIADGTRLDPAYIRKLLNGKVGMPSADRVQRLAGFFGVPIEGLTGAPTARADEDDIDTALHNALSDPRIKAMALRAAALGPREKRLVLKMLEDALDIVSGGPSAGHEETGEHGSATGRKEAEGGTRAE